MIIKFNPAQRPSFVDEHLELDNLITGEQRIGYIIRHLTGDFVVKANDFIITDLNGGVKVLTRELYSSDALQRQDIHDQVGKDTARKVMVLVAGLNLSDVNETDLVNRILAVLVILNAGYIQKARNICNGLVVAGQLTAPRKTGLLNEIDNALTLIA